MKIGYIIPLLMLVFSTAATAQENVEHHAKVVVHKKKTHTFHSRDSSATLYIDTLIMKDKSALMFSGKKDIKLVVGYAEIGDKVYISGSDGKNNASNIDLTINLQKLGSLYVMANGKDAFNGTKTFPNGDGGTVTIAYDRGGISPQSTDKKAANYLFVDVSAGGRAVNATTDLNQIYGRIRSSSAGLRGLPQGQIYSGSPGKEGSFTIHAKD